MKPLQTEPFLRGAPAAFTPMTLTMKPIILWWIPTDYSDLVTASAAHFINKKAIRARYRPWLSLPISLSSFILLPVMR